jgi:hypothetical protein
LPALPYQAVALISAAATPARAARSHPRKMRKSSLEPRLAYKIALEQIDGSFSFDTDDYILESRWRAESASRGDADIFAAKVRSKGKNALGLFVSVNGFKSTFLERFKESTPFITMEGGDLYAVLDNRIRLDDLLRAKKRHANETGSCYLPISHIVS